MFILGLQSRLKYMFYMGVYQHGVYLVNAFFPSVFGLSPVYIKQYNASCFDLITRGSPEKVGFSNNSSKVCN